MRTGKEPPHGSGPEELAATAARAEQAAERLRHALEVSADAHDRAADAYEEQVHRFGGTCLGYASHHGPDLGALRLPHGGGRRGGR